MPKKINPEQRKAVVELLLSGEERHAIAARIGITPGQVSAIAAHITMGSYERDDRAARMELETRQSTDMHIPQEPEIRPSNNMEDFDSNLELLPALFAPIPLGVDVIDSQRVFWNPAPGSGSVNPHVLVIGESGYGKTYSICCLISELAQRGVTSIVFDYGQGFGVDSAPMEFLEYISPVEIHASRDGININPLQLFPTDINGPVNVAQRIADTFQRVYPRLGIQQHAVLRQAVLEALSRAGIKSGETTSWNQKVPEFQSIERVLNEWASDSENPRRKQAADVASHISTIFVFNTFRQTGRALFWPEMIKNGCVYTIQLRGLEHSLERVVTEFLLWNLVGYMESVGPGPLRSFVVLDEAHKLAFDPGSPIEKLLREGRKYGLGLILASQQPEDFSAVAFSNTATKLVFQVTDQNGFVARQIHRKVRNPISSTNVANLITKLPRGCAFAVTENTGKVILITDFATRKSAWPI